MSVWCTKEAGKNLCCAPCRCEDDGAEDELNVYLHVCARHVAGQGRAGKEATWGHVAAGDGGLRNVRPPRPAATSIFC